jgi:hypothetical protein
MKVSGFTHLIVMTMILRYKIDNFGKLIALKKQSIQILR